MHRQRLQQLIAAYGADPARWPASERSAAAAAQADPALLSLLQEARRLDAWFESLPPPAAPASTLAARILAAAPRAPAPRWGWRMLLDELGGARLAAPALACALSLGIGLALLLPTVPAADEAGIDTWLSLALLDEGLDEELLP